MSNDTKELLTLAAKACGYDLDWCLDTCRPAIRDQHGGASFWSPDIDDGDCLRMETELGLMHVWPKQKPHVACWFQVYESEGTIVRKEAFTDHNGDKNAARRLASLRVAAELGRRMPA